MFTSILNTATGSLSIGSGLICTLVSLVLGLVIARVYMVRSNYTKSFVITLVLLPMLVQAVIMMVNGNLGAGVAVLGAFSLVRFRSVPGSSKEIIAIFFAMAVGLAAGMGYLTFAAVLTVVVSCALLALTFTKFGEKQCQEKELKITTAENLDYTAVFNDLFEKYLSRVSLERVKTTNLGSMYELHYLITFKNAEKEKELIDAVRCRNGNLPVSCGRPQIPHDEL